MTAPTGSTTPRLSLGPERNPVRLVLERRRNVYSGDRIAGERHANRARHVRVGGDGGETRRRHMTLDNRALAGRGAVRVGDEELGDTGHLGVARDRVAGGGEIGVKVNRADRNADKRHAIGRMQHVGASPCAPKRGPPSSRWRPVASAPKAIAAPSFRISRSGVCSALNGDCAKIPAPIRRLRGKLA